MNTIYLIRHGESAANAGHATNDPARIPLTVKGETQAKHLAEALDIDCPLVLTSDYDRAIETARPFREMRKVAAQIHALAHEFVTLDPAAVAGTTNMERKPLIDDYWSTGDPSRRTGTGAETFLEFAGRVDSVAAELPTLPDQTAIFGHGMWFAMLIWRTMKFPVDSTRAMKAFRAFQIGLPMPNCCVYELRGTGDFWAVHFNAPIGSHMLSLEEQAYAIQ